MSVPTTNGEPVIDDVAKAVAQSLNKDARSWSVDTTDKLLSRGKGEHQTVITVGDNAAGVTVRVPGAGMHYRAGGASANYVPSDSQDHIWKAFKAWQSDRMAERLAYQPPSEPSPAPEESPARVGPLDRFLAWVFE